MRPQFLVVQCCLVFQLTVSFCEGDNGEVNCPVKYGRNISIAHAGLRSRDFYDDDSYSDSDSDSDSDSYSTEYSEEMKETKTPWQRWCKLPPDIGPCKEIHLRYFYNHREKRCKAFTYSGCFGNKNNFETYNECAKRCERKKEDSDNSENAPWKKERGWKKWCNLPPAKGSCEKKLKRYYYNRRQKRCKSFIYSGCSGNPNNFKTRYKCRERCRKNNPERLTQSDICNLPVKPGNCKARLKRYYFDGKSKTCKNFTYSGCKGNENQFNSRNECKKACIPK